MVNTKKKNKQMKRKDREKVRQPQKYFTHRITHTNMARKVCSSELFAKKKKKLIRYIVLLALNYCIDRIYFDNEIASHHLLSHYIQSIFLKRNFYEEKKTLYLHNNIVEIKNGKLILLVIQFSQVVDTALYVYFQSCMLSLYLTKG